MGMTIYKQGKPVILIDRHIGDDDVYGPGINASDFVRELNLLENANYKEVEVWINSVGGSVIEGMGIYNAISQSKITVNTRNVGVAASTAGWIMQAGKKRIANYYALLMMHGSSGGSNQALNAIDESIISMLASRCMKSENWIRDRMKEETWINADDGLKKHGFYDEVDYKCGEGMEMEYANKSPFAIYNGLKTVVNKLIEQPKEEILMKKVTNKLGLIENAGEESILAGIEAIENKLTAKTTEASELQNKLTTVQNELATKEAELKSLKEEKAASEAAAKKAEEEALKVKAENMVKGFVNKIGDKEETIAFYVKNAIADFEGTKKNLEALPLNKPGVKIMDKAEGEAANVYNMAAVMAEISQKNKK